MNGLHEQLVDAARVPSEPCDRCRARARCPPRRRVLDQDRLSRFQVVVFDEAQEVLVLIDHAGDGDGRVQGHVSSVWTFFCGLLCPRRSESDRRGDRSRGGRASRPCDRRAAR